MRWRHLAVGSLILFFTFSRFVVAQPAQTQPAAQANGRVVVTLTVESLRIPAVEVELFSTTDAKVMATTTSDALGQVVFADVPPGPYVVRARREGFADVESSPFNVGAGSTEQVLIEMRLTFVRESVVVAASSSPTASIQPVAVSDVLSGAKMDVPPLAGDDFQSLMGVLPSVIRGPEGRLRIKGGIRPPGRCK